MTVSKNVRQAAPIVYAIAIVFSALVIGGATTGIVAVIGAMLLGLMYTVSKPKVDEDYDRSAARAERAERRAAR